SGTPSRRTGIVKQGIKPYNPTLRDCAIANDLRMLELLVKITLLSVNLKPDAGKSTAAAHRHSG
ncbi:MAG: hypothetical protein NWR61_04790, partial [Pseudomonadales bacterium]|nr:hypothetical protein [Pseudomonadales bacterium]MDP4765648.1 hypothetical protein [Pseudomonadales bacterium]